MKKAELEMSKVVVIIIAVFTLVLILAYVFTTQGGPKSIIDKILEFLESTTNYAESTAGNI